MKSENAISASVTAGRESIVENRSLNCGRTKVTMTMTTAPISEPMSAPTIPGKTCSRFCIFVWFCCAAASLTCPKHGSHKRYALPETV